MTTFKSSGHCSAQRSDKDKRPGLKYFFDREAALLILTMAAFQFFATVSAAQPVVIGYDHFTSRFAPHSIPGGLPVGDKVQVAAIIDSIDPVGSPTISVKAIQGDTTLTLEPVPPSPLWEGLHLYYKFIDFDPSLLGSWEIIPSDSTGAGPSTMTNAIAEPEFLPFVTKITVQGAPLGTRVAWTLPNLDGFDVNGIGVRIIEAINGRHVWQGVLPVQTTYEIPADVLQIGVDYVYNIILSDDEGSDHENASWSFSEPFRHTIAGDFNTDGAVDAADYAVWRKGFANSAFTVADYNAWRAHFGVSLGPGGGSAGYPLGASADPLSAAVPEPAALALAALALALLVLRRK